MIVRMLSRIDRAISLGVFCRSAPSTSAIMRSRKLLPGSAVTRTRIQSERTLVPPVTAERSPPDSRMTGADSPVMADSSTEAMPSTTSPSAGITSPASTITSSPAWSSAAGTCSTAPSAVRRRATVSVRVLRSSSAWALPRPSAMASAKLANSTVNQSQRATCPVNETPPCPPRKRLTRKRRVTSTLPTATTNITGLRTWTRGSSLRNEEAAAPRTIAGSKSLRSVLATVSCCLPGLEELAGALDELLDQRAEGKHREEGEGADDHHDADQQADEQRGVGRERAGPGGHPFLGGQAAGDGQDGDQEQEAPEEHRDRAGEVVEGRVAGQAGERRAVVVPLGGERVEDLGEAVGAQV